MGANTSIQWTDATISPWDGCTKVGPGCDHCYAEVIADKRFHIVKWGAGQPRKQRESFAANAKKLERKAVREGRQLKVFISMCDPFDNEVPDEWRAELFKLILNTPHLTWQLLTKRIGNAAKMMQDACEAMDTGMGVFAPTIYPNVWIGATVVNQEEADRDIPKLLAVPAAVRFLSIEPMLGAIKLNSAYLDGMSKGESFRDSTGLEHNRISYGAKLDWVICGGESGKDARPMHPDWARSLRDQCTAAGTAFFFKQWGEWIPATPGRSITGATLVVEGVAPFTATPQWHGFPDGTRVARIGTKAAGNLLDGVQWQQFPDVPA